ncbi:hypothetical protein ACJX0J_036631, partial [Zea mays]
TSYELLTGKKPNISYFRVFGSKFLAIKHASRPASSFAKSTKGTHTHALAHANRALMENSVADAMHNKVIVF